MLHFSRKILFFLCLIFLGLVPARGFSSADSLKVATIYQATLKMIYNPEKMKIDSLLHYCEKGIRLAQTHHQLKFIPEFKTNMAYGYKLAGDFDKAFHLSAEAYRDALKINDIHSIARSGYTYAMICFDRGDVELAVKQLSENLQLAHKHQIQRFLQLNYQLLAHMTSYTNNTLITDYYWEKAFRYMGDSSGLHTFKVYVGLKEAIIKRQKEEEEKLYPEFRKVVFKDKELPQMLEMELLVNVANTYQKAGHAKKAIKIFKETSISQVRKSGFPENAFYAGMAAAYLDDNQLKTAEILNQRANQNIWLFFNYSEYLTILKTQAVLQEKKGLFREALNTWNERQRIEDSLSHKRNEISYLLVSNLKNLESLESRFEFVNKENAMQRQLLEKEKRQNLLLLSLVLVLIIFSLVVYALFRKLKVRNQKILEQNEAISLQTESLRESNLVKDKLFSLLSHELRSPVAELITILDVNEWKNKDSTLNPYFKSVNLKAKAIYNTLENILTWSASQLKFRKTEMKPVNIQEIVHKALDLSLPYMQQKKIRVRNEVRDARVDANESYLMIIFRNVLNNATKFTLTNGEIRLYSVEEEQYSGIVVQDSGTGMDTETLKSLFVNAQTSAEGTEGEKGSGVGLILCKDLMDKLQGKVEVSSARGQGTSVKLLFRKSGHFLP